MRISDSNEIQFWLRGQIPYNEEVIPYIQKKPFYQIKKTSDPLRVDGLFDGLSAPTWDVAETYAVGDMVYSTLSGSRFISTSDGNIGHDPSVDISANWSFLIDAPDFDFGITYNTGDVVREAAGGAWKKYVSLVDANLANNPPDFLGVDWDIVIESPEIYKLQAYSAPGTFLEEFPFDNFRSMGMNQAANIDIAFHALLHNKLVRFFIVPTTLAPSIKTPSTWTDSLSAWTAKTATEFIKNGLASFVAFDIRSYEPMFALQGDVLTIRYRISAAGFFAGDVNAIFYAADSAGVSVGTNTFDINPPTVHGFGPNPITVTETITLTGDASRLYIVLSGSIFDGSADVTIDQITGVSASIPDDWLAQSDCVSIQDNFLSSVVVEYSNRNDFDDMGRLGANILSSIRVDGIAWIRDLTTTSEDHPQSSGIILPLRSESIKKLKFEMGPAPDYMHDKMVKIFQHAFIRINGIRYIKRDEYQRTRIDRGTVYFALCWLTDRDSLLVNIGGDLSLAGRVFSDEFSDIFS